MNKERFLELIEKMESDTASATELLELDALYDEFESKPDLLDVRDIQGNLAYRERLFKKISEQAVPEVTEAKIKKLRLAPMAVWFSAAMIAIVFSVYVITKNRKTSDPTETFANDIAPGKNGATLTLANGKKIYINDALAGNIAEQSGVKITKTKDGQIIYEITDNNSGKLEYNTLSTTRGEQTQVRLPDGSLVFLNAASSLKYPTTFANQPKRNVSLTGEGYFEISKDKSHPFIVYTDRQQVEVLGTHFNINSYANEPLTKTTLLEGSVKVTANSVEKMLKPNQQSQLAQDKFIIANVDGDGVIAWKNGLFVFEDESLESIMKRVERWYDVEIIYHDDVNKNTLYGGSVSRYDKVSKVLEGLELTKGVHFKIEGRRILVMK